MSFDDTKSPKQHNKNLIKFFFPLYPIKVFHSIKTMTVIGVLIALRLVFNLFSIPIPASVQYISFVWIPLMVMGWFFGPVYGLLFGAVTDTLCYVIFTRGLWFWMYAIQEPLVCMISGIFGGVYRIRINNKNKKSFWLDIGFQQFIYFSFAIICYVIMIVYLVPVNASKPSTDQFTTKVFKYVSATLLAVFLIVMELITVYQIKQNKENKSQLMIFIYGTTLTVVLAEIFSFLLGPISSYEYYVYLNGKEPTFPGFQEFGLMYFLAPRIVTQTFKVPLESFLLTALLLSFTPSFFNIISNQRNKWM